MSEMPMKYYWRGKDVEEMSREQLLVVVRGLASELERSRKATAGILDMQQQFFDAARARRAVA